jgi:transposase
MGIRLGTIVAPMAFRGGMNGPTFLTYVEKVLSPWLRPGDIVLADQLGAHRTEGCAKPSKPGAEYRLLPPYSSDFSPIEQCFSKIRFDGACAPARVTFLAVRRLCCSPAAARTEV